MRKLSHWLEELSPAESIDFYRDMAYSHAREGGLIGSYICGLIAKDKIREICEYEVPSPDHMIWLLDEGDDVEDGIALDKYVNADRCEQAELDALAVARYKAVRQAVAFFSKVEGLEIGIDKDAVALDKFLEAEELCKESNTIFQKLRLGEVSFPPRVCSVLHEATRKISRILGSRLPKLEELDLRFGPGATRGVRRKDASVRRKIGERLQCSENLLPLLPFLLQELPQLVDVHQESEWLECYEDWNELWSRVNVEVIPARLGFVPKNAKTSRTICTEPGLNVLAQAGIGSYIAKRLAAFGIDIRDQSVNQRRALEGSLTGALATLDLSSASDTISREIVKMLLPLDWALLLERTRSTYVEIPTRKGWKRIRQEKFSSMGNGFTFPLETLIFWSLASSCCERDDDATVYGDDIIVPTDRAGLVKEVLHYCGFKVNHGKSYTQGFFRESCGKDYYKGIAVRPFYPRGWVSGQSLFVMHNHYVRCGDEVRAAAVRKAIHPQNLIFGPDGYGDGHLIGSYQHRRPDRIVRQGYDGHFFDSFVTRSSRDEIPLQKGEYVVPLYSVYRRSEEPLLPGVTQQFEAHQPLLGVARKWLCQGAPSGAPLPLPNGELAKKLPLPGASGYKKVSIYILGR